MIGEYFMKEIDQKSQLLAYIKKFNLEGILHKEWVDACSLQVFEKGEYICEVDQEANYFYFVVEGKAKIYTLLSNGKKFLLRFYLPFNILGDVEVINQNKYKVFAEALNSCVCIALPMKIARTQGLKSPEFLIFLCEHLVEKLDTITSKISINLLYSVEERLASYIYESYNPQTKSFIIQSSYSDLAEALGTSYRHLNRTILQLIDKGIVEKEGKALIILNEDALKSMGSGLYH